jgi:DNA repair exonuclease SbcCD ATPase subunit
MILERVAVQGFRALVAPYEFKPSKHLTIISAPNGTGKSTLLDAIYHGLLERHSVSGEKAKDRLLSRGRQLVPRVEIDFSIEAGRFRLSKAFLHGKSSKLERWEVDRYVLLSEGHEADTYIRELFVADVPGGGPVDAKKHWGLAHVLWAPGGAQYDAMPASASDTVRSMLGGVVMATVGERAVEDCIEARYLDFFTPGGGEATSASSRNLPELEKRLTDANDAAATAQAELDRYTGAQQAYNDCVWQLERLTKQRDDLRTDLVVAREHAARYELLISDRATRIGTEDRLRTEADVARTNVQTIDEIVTASQASVAKRSEVTAELTDLEDRLASVTEQIQDATRKLDDAAARRNEVLARGTVVSQAEAFIRDRDDRDAGNNIIETLESMTSALHELRERRRAISAPTDDELRELRAADASRHTLEAQIATSALALEILPTEPVTINVLSGDQIGDQMIAADGRAVLTGPEEITVDIPGFGRIKARGVDGAAKLRKKLETVAQALASGLTHFGVASVSELEERSGAATELDRLISGQESTFTAMGGEAELDRRRLLFTAAMTRLATTTAEHPEWAKNAPDAVQLRRGYDAAVQLCVDEARAAEVTLRALDGPKAEIAKRIAVLQLQERALQEQEQVGRGRLEQLQSDGLTADERVEKRDLLALEWTAARATRVKLDDDIAEFAGDPRPVLTSLEAQQQAMDAEHERLNGKVHSNLALLEEFAQRGSYQKVTEALEAAAELERQLEAARAESRAAKLLRELIQTIRAEHIEAVLRPVEASATTYLHRIAGPYLGTVNVNHDLTPGGTRYPDGSAMVPLTSNYSTGEREQIFLATRLALAGVISGNRGRQLFVIDDALTATDPARLRRFTMLLDELAQHDLQIIVATSDPSRYLGCANAMHVDLRGELDAVPA